MTDRASKRAVLIAGPTASGKSALALALAEALGGTIINADSMQVYRDLRIVTARPSAQEEARVPHLLYGHVDAAENYSVGRWCVDASAALGAVGRAAGLGAPSSRPSAPRHESTRRAVADPASQRRDRLGRSGGRGKARHPALQQAPGHLVSPSAAGLDLGHARHGVG